MLVYNIEKFSFWLQHKMFIRFRSTKEEDECSGSKITGLNIFVLWSKAEIFNNSIEHGYEKPIFSVIIMLRVTINMQNWLVSPLNKYSEQVKCLKTRGPQIHTRFCQSKDGIKIKWYQTRCYETGSDDILQKSFILTITTHPPTSVFCFQMT